MAHGCVHIKNKQSLNFKFYNKNIKNSINFRVLAPITVPGLMIKIP